MKFTRLVKASMILAASAVVLTACQSSNKSATSFNSKLITYKNGDVSAKDVYELAIKDTEMRQKFHDKVITEVFYSLYGKEKKVKENVDKVYQSYIDEAGSEEALDKLLDEKGLTKDTLMTQLLEAEAYQYGLRDLLNVQDSELSELYKSYTPDVTIKVAVFSDEKSAQSLYQAITNGSDFKSKADELGSIASTDDKSELTFDSHDNQLPQTILNETYKLKAGEISKVLSHVDEATQTPFYFVVQMIKPADKSSDWKKHKDRLHEIYTQSQLSDSATVDKLENKALSKANFIVNDEDLKSLFNSELNAK